MYRRHSHLICLITLGLPLQQTSCSSSRNDGIQIKSRLIFLGNNHRSLLATFWTTFLFVAAELDFGSEFSSFFPHSLYDKLGKIVFAHRIPIIAVWFDEMKKNQM